MIAGVSARYNINASYEQHTAAMAAAGEKYSGLDSQLPALP
jgi:hypothetical protein